VIGFPAKDFPATIVTPNGSMSSVFWMTGKIVFAKLSHQLSALRQVKMTLASG